MASAHESSAEEEILMQFATFETRRPTRKEILTASRARGSSSDSDLQQAMAAAAMLPVQIPTTVVSSGVGYTP